jgi:GAF domain-containing protein
MPAAPTPANEAERLAALAALGILHTEPSPDFDIFPVLASKLFNAPMAAVSFVAADTQWFKASVGLDVSETPRDESFCAYTIMDPSATMCVADATADARFADNPLVTGSFGLRRGRRAMCAGRQAA